MAEGSNVPWQLPGLWDFGGISKRTDEKKDKALADYLEILCTNRFSARVLRYDPMLLGFDQIVTNVHHQNMTYEIT